jgi:predicted secreted protein
MAVQSGKDLLIKIDQTGDGQFVTIAGLRATRISFNTDRRAIPVILAGAAAFVAFWWGVFTVMLRLGGM